MAEAPRDPAPEPETGPQQGVASIPILWIAVAVGAAAVVFAFIVISQVGPALSGLLNPPLPPAFTPSTLVEERDLGNGEQEWHYATESPGCDVYAWYAERADFCRLSPGTGCAGGDQHEHNTAYSIAYCTGHTDFGDFIANWEVYIHDGYNEPARSQFLIARTIDWMNQN